MNSRSSSTISANFGFLPSRSAREMPCYRERTFIDWRVSGIEVLMERASPSTAG